jgi:hypothetical protein
MADYAALIRPTRCCLIDQWLRRSGFKFPGMSKIEQWSPSTCRMVLVGIMPGPEGLELRTFECRKCDHSFTNTVAKDPMNKVSAGWITGASNPPT